MSKTPRRLWRKDAPVAINYTLCKWSCSIPLLLYSGVSLAAEMVALGNGEEQYFSTLPVVVSVTRLPQTPLELPASLTVIDQRMIESSGVTDIPELLRLVAGFQIAHVDGAHYSVTYHGLGDNLARRIQVLVDGRSVYMPATSSVDWADLPLSIEDIDHIEVLRGPNGEAFGDNSFSGVVNIITREAASTPGTYVRLQGGQGNYRRAVARQGGSIGNLDFRITMEHQSDDGFKDVLIDNNLYSLKDDKLSNKVNIRGDYRAGVNDYLQFNLGTNSGMRGMGYNTTTTKVSLSQEEPAYDMRNWRHFEQLKWRHVASSDEELQLQFYHNYTDDHSYYETDPSVGPLVVDMNILAERYDLELEHRFRMNDALRLVWGGEIRVDEVTAPGYLNQTSAISNMMSRGFAHTEWRPVENYLVNVGAMVEHNEIAGTHISPRVAMNWQFDDEHAARFSVTRAYRTPAILEQNADYRATLVGMPSIYYQLWQSQGDLRSEKITSYEIGFMGTLGAPRNQYDVKLFKDYVRDIISHPLWLGYPSPVAASTLYFYNNDWADLGGIEVQLKTYAVDDTMLSFGYSYIQSQGTYTKRLNPETIESASYNIPSNTFSWLVDHPFDSNWHGSLAFYHVDHIAFWHQTTVSTVDVRVARRFKMAASEGEISLVARDIAGSYYDYQDERVIDPRCYLSLEYQW